MKLFLVSMLCLAAMASGFKLSRKTSGDQNTGDQNTDEDGGLMKRINDLVEECLEVEIAQFEAVPTGQPNKRDTESVHGWNEKCEKLIECYHEATTEEGWLECAKDIVFQSPFVERIHDCAKYNHEKRTEDQIFCNDANNCLQKEGTHEEECFESMFLHHYHDELKTFVTKVRSNCKAFWDAIEEHHDDIHQALNMTSQAAGNGDAQGMCIQLEQCLPDGNGNVPNMKCVERVFWDWSDNEEEPDNDKRKVLLLRRMLKALTSKK